MLILQTGAKKIDSVLRLIVHQPFVRLVRYRFMVFYLHSRGRRAKGLHERDRRLAPKRSVFRMPISPWQQILLKLPDRQIPMSTCALRLALLAAQSPLGVLRSIAVHTSTSGRLLSNPGNRILGLASSNHCRVILRTLGTHQSRRHRPNACRRRPVRLYSIRRDRNPFAGPCYTIRAAFQERFFL